MCSEIFMMIFENIFTLNCDKLFFEKSLLDSTWWQSRRSHFCAFRIFGEVNWLVVLSIEREWLNSLGEIEGFVKSNKRISIRKLKYFGKIFLQNFEKITSISYKNEKFVDIFLLKISMQKWNILIFWEYLQGHIGVYWQGLEQL